MSSAIRLYICDLRDSEETGGKLEARYVTHTQVHRTR